jgi:hypothetical protein
MIALRKPRTAWPRKINIGDASVVLEKTYSGVSLVGRVLNIILSYRTLHIICFKIFPFIFENFIFFVFYFEPLKIQQENY